MKIQCVLHPHIFIKSSCNSQRDLKIMQIIYLKCNGGKNRNKSIYSVFSVTFCCFKIELKL